MRNGARLSIIGGVFALMVGGAGYGAWNLLSTDSGGSGGPGGSTSDKSGPPSADEVRDVTGKFFEAWENGKADDAARLTNFSSDATGLLGTFSKVKVTPGKASGTQVPYKVSATATYEGKSKTFSYESSLKVVRGNTTKEPLVDWDPSVVHPDLKKDDTLKLGEAEAAPIKALDRNGKELTEDKYPSLGPILGALREKYAEDAGGKPGVELWIERAGDSDPDETLLTLEKGKPALLRTRLSATVQAAAEKAVSKYPKSSVVAIQPSSGDILAVANEQPFNTAFSGTLAPGSTMKMVSAATLIDQGVTSADKPAPCPPTATWQSRTIGNLKGMQPNENATLANSFARSCNTAFVKYADELKVDDLTNEARNYFGIGANWQTGIESFDGRVPASGGGTTAENLIGQGEVQMNPLNLASIAATVKAGAFHQPILVPASYGDRQLATAKPLSGSTAVQLRQMMRLTATSNIGTATRVMAGLGGDIGAKTGSAEVDGAAKSNSSFAGYRDNVAAAALVEQGGHGGDAAGPIVAEVLRAGS
ncbi:penicillin-binding transpeptidase domain-containing protein [Streptomyces sp. NBC_01304]|uniref:penicillin-binding transpeptidase domain-containing protein n=1 Tax=Streptomyces sp. NBC_01304 TaxID=2903818 RepID=UPI002E13E041|nr:penicillin-binding transpeptidase domain-containing protein [Streptomyces sp. NBC_01304]